MSGYARFHRSLVGHPAFRNDAEAMAFAYMVLRASWRDTRVRYKGRAVELRRGQLSMSQRDMADALDRDKAWIERLWKRLRDEGMIAVAYEAGAAVITICNYDKYQHSNDDREAPGEAVNEADARQTQGTEQVREEIKKEPLSEERGRARPAKADPFPRPEWAEPAIWADFLTNRKRKSLPNTATAYRKLIADIERLIDPDWPPGRLLEAATAKGWGAIYPSIKDNGHAETQRHRQQPARPSSDGAFEAFARAAGFGPPNRH